MRATVGASIEGNVSNPEKVTNNHAYANKRIKNAPLAERCRSPGASPDPLRGRGTGGGRGRSPSRAGGAGIEWENKPNTRKCFSRGKTHPARDPAEPRTRRARQGRGDRRGGGAVSSAHAEIEVKALFAFVVRAKVYACRASEGASPARELASERGTVPRVRAVVFMGLSMRKS